jgi:hypothetical protein
MLAPAELGKCEHPLILSIHPFKGAVANPTLAGWGESIYLDVACSGQMSNSDALITAPLAASAGQMICVLMREFAPPTAPTVDVIGSWEWNVSGGTAV